MIKYLGFLLFLAGLAITFVSSYEAIEFYGVAPYARSLGIIIMAIGLVTVLFLIGRKSNKN